MTIRVLMLSLLLGAPLGAETRAVPATAPTAISQPAIVSNPVLPDAFGATQPQQPFSLNGTESQPNLTFQTKAQDSRDICYKIRAFIFKRDDDHAPELVKETTCGPGQPRAHAAEWPKAKLVPAK